MLMAAGVMAANSDPLHCHFSRAAKTSVNQGELEEEKTMSQFIKL